MTFCTRCRKRLTKEVGQHPIAVKVPSLTSPNKGHDLDFPELCSKCYDGWEKVWREKVQSKNYRKLEEIFYIEFMKFTGRWF